MRQLLLTLFSLCASSLLAQNFYPPVVNYSTKDYGKNQDRNAENFAVVQDRRGVMYFGTDNGVTEFDGEQWNYIKTGSGSFVRALGVDDAGIIYAGFYGDFGYFKPDTFGRLVFQSLLSKIPEDYQFFSNVWKIHSVGKRIYFQTEEGLYIYDVQTKKIKVIPPKNSFHTSFMVDSTVYLRDRQVGLVKLVNDKLVTLKSSEIFKEYGLFGMHRLPDDSLLLITQELGLFKWKNGGIQPIPEQNEIQLSELGIIGSLHLSTGDFALNTLTNGVVVINEHGKINKRINRNIGIRSDAVHQIYQDRDLNLWLALENGIAKVNYHSPLSFFDEKAGIEGNVQSMIRFKNELYVGTSYGLFIQEDDDRTGNQFRNTGIIKDQVWTFSIVENNLYIGASNGLFKTSDGINFTRINEYNVNTIIYRPTRQDFIIAGAQGIFVLDQNFNEKWSNISNYSNFIGGTVDPENDSIIWLGTTASYMQQLIEKKDGFELDIFDDFSGLLDGFGRPMLFKGKLIFGGKKGLFRIESEEKRKLGLTAEELKDPLFYRVTFEPFALYDSLFDGQLYLLEVGEDRTWYCNEYKIGFYDHTTKTFQNRPFWGIAYGRFNNFYLENDGTFWIGSAEGLIRYEKNNLKNYESTFFSLIRKVTITKGTNIFNGVFVDGNGNIATKQNSSEIPALTYSNNDIEFFFSAPYFEDEHKPEYHYILEGTEDGWSNWKEKSDASYNNLQEGTYTFRVEARNIYGQISEQASYTFTILPPWYRTAWAYFLYVVALILLLLLGIKISSKRLKAQNVRLEWIVKERTKEVSQKNIVLQRQKQEIQDSINYAQRIQQAILPLEDEMKKWIPKSFVLFRPKDIVSGDFYWFIERENKLVFICADCTGHGVPGAFMSMIGSDRLNNIVSENKITSPGEILSALNRAIKKSLKQDGQKKATRDGMDAAVCTVDLSSNTLRYAGANRSLWIVDQKGENLEEIKASKVAIAGLTPDDQVFEQHIVELTPGLKFYMTTDGYADQFGSEKNKKYMVKTLKNFITKNALLDFEEQKRLLEQELVNWMGEHDQVDDVCVVGFEL